VSEVKRKFLIEEQVAYGTIIEGTGIEEQVACGTIIEGTGWYNVGELLNEFEF
jgi:hypothetical protein